MPADNKPDSRPEFSRPRVVEALSHKHPTGFDEAPTPDEAEALRALLGLLGLRKFRFTGEISPLRRDEWALRGTLGASVTQECVVTLEPVRSRIETEVLIHFVPPAKMDDTMEERDFDETQEPLGEVIDLGLIATEALALALPPYPRKQDAVLDMPDSSDDGADEKPNPFAALATLKDKLGKPQ
ncbi:YceD family protein [Abyssibius alkaniclasticus]|uniref:YceD family protein n=1 Tax=Abyssibius alkaniclasticus TaxID=2881234 RepID=UPI00405988A9